MESVFTLIIGALIGFVVLNRKGKAQAEKELAETKAKDAALKEQQELVQSAIKTLDQGIDKMRKEKELQDKKRAEDNLSLAERRERLKKGIQ